VSPSSDVCSCPSQLRPQSLNGHLPGWRLMPIIVKSNDDLRQEQFVSQLLFQFDSVFKAAGLPVWLRPYDILAITDTGGLIEVRPWLKWGLIEIARRLELGGGCAGCASTPPAPPHNCIVAAALICGGDSRWQRQ
jgi:hypothetical protein